MTGVSPVDHRWSVQLARAYDKSRGEESAPFSAAACVRARTSRNGPDTYDDNALSPIAERERRLLNRRFIIARVAITRARCAAPRRGSRCAQLCSYDNVALIQIGSDRIGSLPGPVSSVSFCQINRSLRHSRTACCKKCASHWCCGVSNDDSSITNNWMMVPSHTPLSLSLATEQFYDHSGISIIGLQYSL